MKNLKALQTMKENMELQIIAKEKKAAKNINNIGPVLSAKEIERLNWTLDTHIGAIIGNYFSDTASLVGATTVAGDKITAIKLPMHVLFMIEKSYLANGDGTGTERYESYLKDKIVATTGVRGLKSEICVVSGEKAAKEVLRRLASWDVVNATIEEVEAFVFDMTELLRAAQEIEIDITKDKSLVRFIELTKMIRPGAYILSEKFKTQETWNNKGLVNNIKELRQAKLSKDSDVTYDITIGHLTYKIGRTEMTEEEIEQGAELINGNVIKIVDKEMVDNSLVDSYSAFQEQLSDASTKVLGVLASMAQDKEIDYVIQETYNDIKTNALPEAVKTFASDISVLMKAIASYDRMLKTSGVEDKKGVIKEMSGLLRNSIKQMWLGNAELANQVNPKTLETMGITFTRLFSKALVAAELFDYDNDRKQYDFKLKSSIPVVKSYCKADYISLQVDNNVKEFEENTYPTFGIADDVEDGEVVINGRLIMRGDVVLGRVASDRISRKMEGKRFYIERNEEKQAILVEKISIKDLAAINNSNELLVVTSIAEFDGFLKSDLVHNGKNSSQEELNEFYALREEYIDELKDLIADAENIAFNANESIIKVDDVDFKVPTQFRNALLGLAASFNVSLESNIEMLNLKSKDVVKSLEIKDVFFSGNKLAMVVAK